MDTKVVTEKNDLINDNVMAFDADEKEKQDIFEIDQSFLSSKSYHSGNLSSQSAKRKGKNLYFLINGNKFFKGIKYCLCLEKIRSFDCLLQDLNRLIQDVTLPKGVQFIYLFLPHSKKRKIDDLKNFENGGIYICSSFDSYIDLDYKKVIDGYFNFFNLAKSPSRDKSAKSNGSLYHSGTSTTLIKTSPFCNQFIKPKLITVINHGPKPREAIKLLLNKKTVHSFDQVLTNIQEKFKIYFGPIKKIFSLSGKPILLLKDFFEDEDIFITFVCDKISQQDFELHSEEFKHIHTKMSNRDSNKCIYSPSKRLFSSNNSLRSSLVSKSDYLSSISSSVSSASPNLENNDNVSSKKVTKYLKNCILSEKEEKEVKKSSPCLDKDFKKSVISSRFKSSPLKHSQIPSFQNLKKEQKNCNFQSSKDLNPTKFSSQKPHQNNSSLHSLSVIFPRQINSKYKVGLLIGYGNFAVVHECIDKSNGQCFALKIINKSNNFGKEAMIANEVKILQKISHPNVIGLYDVFDFYNKLYLVMEYVAGGDLFETIHANENFINEPNAKGLINNLLNALEYLHSINICHRDIKPENLLVSYYNNKVTLKLADFGLAVEIQPGEKLYMVCGTPIYVAPEMIAETGYDFKVDIWATGIITYILLCGFPPFMSEQNDENLFDQILRGQVEFKTAYWSGISSQAKDFVICLLQVYQNKRINAMEALSHSWFKTLQ